ncbi:hypothetical protein O3P69_020535 [Scylla paramamosain]|uniref:Uncharacterized protein n=1 Tax=Scylla paramamosain TaxID=85552 RepID=A0AAW0TLL7_SCYPA
MNKPQGPSTPPDFTPRSSNEGIRVVWFLARIGQSHVVRGGVAEGAGRGKAGLGVRGERHRRLSSCVSVCRGGVASPALRLTDWQLTRPPCSESTKEPRGAVRYSVDERRVWLSVEVGTVNGTCGLNEGSVHHTAREDY